MWGRLGLRYALAEEVNEEASVYLLSEVTSAVLDRFLPDLLA